VLAAQLWSTTAQQAIETAPAGLHLHGNQIDIAGRVT
jgi:hypothetical protein